MQLPRKVPFQPRAVQCTRCAAPLTIRDTYHTMSAVCGSCGSILDARDPNLAILQAEAVKGRFQPAIPLGQRGQMMGDKWECIGAMLRSTQVEGITYYWREYLLFNPYKGYRWLVEANGHWSWVEPATGVPLVFSKHGKEVAHHEDSEFKLFQTCKGRVEGIIGEFYWQVTAGEQVQMKDFVAPPFMLSKERSPEEVVWSLGCYVDPTDVSHAFGLGPMPAPRGVAPAQPNPYDGTTRLWVRTFVFLLVGMMLHVMHLGQLDTKQIAIFKFRYDAADPAKAKVSETFEITGTRPATIQVNSFASLNNQWIYLQMALINEDTQVAYDFAREISLYSGVDSDGAWSEGSFDDQVVIGSIPPGRYYLLVEPQTEFPAIDYHVAIVRDPERHWPFVALFFLFLIPPFLHHAGKQNFEVKRWSESDYPLVTHDE